VLADRRLERGSAAVEFALLLPILLLLLLALVQVGVIARDSLLLTQASRAGARGLYGLGTSSGIRSPPIASVTCRAAGRLLVTTFQFGPTTYDR
jgi:Flp pilus assembly protein TadG